MWRAKILSGQKRKVLALILLIAFAPIAAIDARAAFPAPTYHYNFENSLLESSRTTSYDKSGTTTFVSNGAVGQAVVMTTSNYLWNTTFGTGNTAYSMTAWLNTTDIPNDDACLTNQLVWNQIRGAGGGAAVGMSLKDTGAGVKQVCFGIYDGTSNVVATATLPQGADGNTTFVGGTFANNGVVAIYVNGTQIANTSVTTIVTQGGTGATGAASWSLGNAGSRLASMVDELMIWAGTELTPPQMLEVYQNQTPAAAPPAPFVSSLSISATDFYDGSSINNLTVNVSNTTFSVVNRTTSGSLLFAGIANLTNYTVMVGSNASGGYFNATLNLTINGTTTATARLYQAIISVSAFEKVSNASIASFNASASTQFNTSAGGAATFLLKAGTYQFLGAAAGYANTTLSSFTVSALQNGTAQLKFFTQTINFSVANGITGATIGSFTVNVTNATYSYAEAASTTTGLLVMNASAGIFNATATVTGYAPVNTTFTIPTGGNVSFSVFPVNTIYFRIFDEQTNALITTTNITIGLTGPNVQYNASTGNGTLVMGSLLANDYLVDMQNLAALYFPRQYKVTLPDGFGVQLDAYLINASAGSFITIFVRSNLDQLLDNVSIAATSQLNNSFVVVEQRTTDVTGGARFALNPLKTYKLILSSPGYLARTVTVSPVSTPITINLQSQSSTQPTSPYSSVSYTTGPGTVVSANITNFTLTTSSPSGALLSFAITATFNGSTYMSNVSGSPNGGIAFLTLNLSNATGPAVNVSYLIQVAGLADVRANQTFYVGQPGSLAPSSTTSGALTNLANELSPAMKGFITSGVVALACVVTALFGLPAMGVAFVGFGVLIFMTIVHFVNPFITIVTGTLAIMAWLAYGRREAT